LPGDRPDPARPGPTGRSPGPGSFARSRLGFPGPSGRFIPAVVGWEASRELWLWFVGKPVHRDCVVEKGAKPGRHAVARSVLGEAPRRGMLGLRIRRGPGLVHCSAPLSRQLLCLRIGCGGHAGPCPARSCRRNRRVPSGIRQVGRNRVLVVGKERQARKIHSSLPARPDPDAALIEVGQDGRYGILVVRKNQWVPGTVVLLCMCAFASFGRFRGGSDGVGCPASALDCFRFRSGGMVLLPSRHGYVAFGCLRMGRVPVSVGRCPESRIGGSDRGTGT
jgi:hypothetical protein